MNEKKRVITPPRKANPSMVPKATPPTQPNRLNVNFSKFKITPICLRGRFNNHFKDEQHFSNIANSFLGTVLPKVTSHTYSEICEGSQEGRVLHFHAIDKAHQEIVRDILKEYHFSTLTIDQMLEGNDLFNFSATLGHTYAARIVCHKVDNVLFLLFLDTNHHVYMNEKYLRDSLFYEDCPSYINGDCSYMPSNCFAFGLLDEEKIQESFGYTASP